MDNWNMYFETILQLLLSAMRNWFWADLSEIYYKFWKCKKNPWILLLLFNFQINRFYLNILILSALQHIPVRREIEIQKGWIFLFVQGTLGNLCTEGQILQMLFTWASVYQKGKINSLQIFSDKIYIYIYTFCYTGEHVEGREKQKWFLVWVTAFTRF